MSNELVDTVALVTGASSGIGEAAARRLAADGAAVALVARRQERLEELAGTIRASGGTALVVKADVTQKDEALGAVETAVEKLGRLDTLVNAAGVMFNAPSLDIPLDDWEMMVDINLKGVLYLVKGALPHLLAAAETGPRRVADVVNISSIAGRFARATVAGYNATKFGVSAATEAWRQEFTQRGVRFSVIEPGATATELFAQREYMADYASTLLNDLEELRAGDIADAIAYIVENPRRIAVAEIVLRSIDQA
jgi:NADP-dependent 3-hydroxy acid dehydrogenase YdfG